MYPPRMSCQICQCAYLYLFMCKLIRSGFFCKCIPCILCPSFWKMIVSTWYVIPDIAVTYSDSNDHYVAGSVETLGTFWSWSTRGWWRWTSMSATTSKSIQFYKSCQGKVLKALLSNIRVYLFVMVNLMDEFCDATSATSMMV